VYQEPVVATGDLDVRISDVLRSAGLGGGMVGSDLPPPVLDFINLLPGWNDEQAVRKWCDLAETLAGMTCVLSSWYAFQQAIQRCRLAASRGGVVARRAEMLEQHGFGIRAACDRRVAARLRRQSFPAGRIVELEADGLAVVSCQGDKGEFSRLSGLFISPLTDDPVRNVAFAKAHFHSVVFEQFGQAVDLSFLIVDADYRPILQVECDALSDDIMACRNSPIALTPLTENAMRAIPLALRQLEVNAHWLGLAEILLQVWDDDFGRAILEWASSRQAVVNPMRYAAIKLDRPLADILADFRQTHRNLARWGMANLSFETSYSHAPLELIRTYQALLRQEGRGVMEAEDEMLRRVEQGEISLHAALRNGTRESVVVVSYCGNVAYYSGAVRTHDQNKSSAQALLYHIIGEMQGRGLRELILGDLLDGEGFDPKLRSIAAFKAGFTKYFRPGHWVRARSGITPSVLDLRP